VVSRLGAGFSRVRGVALGSQIRWLVRSWPEAIPSWAMSGAAGQMNVERIGDVIVARLCGEPTTALICACQGEVLRLLGGAPAGKVLYDTLDMLPPPVDVPWAQRELDEAMGGVRWRRAIVVPTSRLAFLARLAFGDGDYRVFYDDLAAAVRWLGSDGPPFSA
jgi:hypothetical protein